MNTIEVRFEALLHLAVAVVIAIGFTVFMTIQINIHPQSNPLVYLPMLALLMVYFYKILNVVLSKSAVLGPESISLQTAFGNFEIRVDDIEYILQGAGNMKIGNSKQTLSLPDVEYWTPKSSSEFFNSYREYLASRGIRPETTLGAFWPRQRNCRTR